MEVAMPLARTWTDDADSAIRVMRAAGETWASIGRSLGLSRNTVIERGRRLRAAAPLRSGRPLLEKPVSEDPNRAPLPPGHKLTWGLLTDHEFPQYRGDFSRRVE
jgi:hypothetical protein